jgi:hypothetical protein
MIAAEKRPEAFGDSSIARTAAAPALWPNSVTRDGSPPKACNELMIGAKVARRQDMYHDILLYPLQSRNHVGEGVVSVQTRPSRADKESESPQPTDIDQQLARDGQRFLHTCN